MAYTFNAFKALGLFTLVDLLAAHTVAQASGLALKKASYLGEPPSIQSHSLAANLPGQQARKASVVGTLGFRGVLVLDQHPGRSVVSAPTQNDLQDKRAKMWSAPIMPVKGTLQVPVQDNLSILYAPVSLTKGAGGSDSQGLYVLRNTSLGSSWFLGVESGEYALGNGGRENARSAHLGVIFALN